MTDTDEQRQRELAKAEECLNTITYKHDGQPRPNRSEARTKPNQRLVEVFGIKNIITDEKKMRAACKMSTTDDKGDWTDLRERAIEYYDVYMQLASGDGSVNLTELVRFITLKVSLSYLFADAETASKTKNTIDDIKLIGRRINDLWIDSKKPDGERPHWEDQHDLHNSLRRVITATSVDVPGSFNQDVTKGAQPIVREHNPLNYLLPAYETMWRVVHRCFIEVNLRGAVSKSEWQLVLANFLDELSDPSCMPKAFHRDSSTGLRPSDIAKEALRLYPPSRHLHRDFDGELHRADIEACHRSKLLGGDDPLIFRPQRWLSICPEERADKVADPASRAKTRALKNGEQELGFMPSATYCAADKSETKAFAMKMIVMLVAILCDGLGDAWVLAADVGSMPQPGVPLESDRAVYEDLVLMRL